MSQPPPDDPFETQPVAAGEGFRSPPPTERLRVARGPGGGPPPALWVFLGLLLLAGMLIGFVFGHFIGRPGGQTPGENLVLFETASSVIPFPGAQFTSTTFDERRGLCDKTKLKQFLRADQRRFDAWIKLVGISAAEFDPFVNRLETGKLTSLSPVTNHGCFSSGECPFAFQSVLAPGTPVWRDPVRGRIVAKCACSNPLSAPQCPPNCNPGGASSPAPAPAPAPTPRAEQTLPPETPAPTATPAATPPPVRTPEPVPTVAPA